MSNLHANQDEANKHTAKGFDLVGNNTRPWKDENNEQTFTENNELPRAINFVDGTLAPPSTTDGDVFVLIGSGVLHPNWGGNAFGNWVRYRNLIPVGLAPVKGMLCYDDTASTWMEFDGSVWAAFGGGGGGVTNLSEGTVTNTTVDVDSDTGTNATLQPASTIRAGVMSKAKFDEVVLNNAKVSNVDTDLSLGPISATSMDVNSSDGTNVTLTAADATFSGVMTAAKFNEVVANNAKVSADGSIDTHSDVDTSTTAPVTGDVLVWDGTDWINSNIYLATGATPAVSLRLHQELLSGIGRLTWEGTTGGLFSIIDDKDNELWTVSDISGNPIGYIDADWNVRLGNPFNRPFSIRYDSATGVSYTKQNFPDYANDAAADADPALLSGESYTTSAVNRTISIKP